jgi:hypothetical protein
VTAVVPDPDRKRVLAIYSDKMMFLWDFANIKQLTICRQFFSHNGPIHDIQKVESRFKVGLKEEVDGD